MSVLSNLKEMGVNVEDPHAVVRVLLTLNLSDKQRSDVLHDYLTESKNKLTIALRKQASFLR